MQHVSTTECDADLFMNALGMGQFVCLRGKIQVRKAQAIETMNITGWNYVDNMTTKASTRTTPNASGGYQFYMSKDGMNLIGFTNLLMTIPQCLA